MKKNNKLEWVNVASVNLTDEVIDKSGVREFLYVSPTTEKYHRTLVLSFAKDDKGKQIIGVNIVGHTADKNFVDQTLKHLHSAAKKRLWELAIESDTPTGVGQYDGLPKNVISTIISSLLAS